jgi:hypothetical protein
MENPEGEKRGRDPLEKDLDREIILLFRYPQN